MLCVVDIFIVGTCFTVAVVQIYDGVDIVLQQMGQTWVHSVAKYITNLGKFTIVKQTPV